MRLALGIEYAGQDYHGWQAQDELKTVQGTLETALSKVAAETIEVFCAGRTDAGVHGVGQVVHFDTQVEREDRAWVFGVNSILPPSIAVRWVQRVDEHFHARFSASARRYRYVIYNHRIRSALLASRVCLHYAELDVQRMQAAAQYFLGEQDFSSFRSSRCESKTTFRHVNDISIYREASFIVLEIEANAFLHHMVRNIVGVLLKVGEGKADPEWIPSVLEARDRRAAAETAPSQGLYLLRVTYPDPYVFPVNNPGLDRFLLL